MSRAGTVLNSGAPIEWSWPLFPARRGYAVPAYLNFQGKAQTTAALSEVREVIPSANAYYVTNGNFAGMNANSLRSGYDSGLTISSGGSTGIVSAKPEGDGQSYCISALADGHWSHYSGPGGSVIADPTTVTENPCS